MTPNPPEVPSDVAIVCLSPLPWAGDWTSRHALSKVWAEQGTQVVFVDPPVRMLSTSRLPQRATPRNVTVVTPTPRPPYGVFGGGGTARAVINLIADRYARSVEEQVRRLVGHRRLLLFNSFMPVIGHRVQRKIEPVATIYHCADDLRAFPSFRPLYGEIESRVAADADAVVCVTEAVRDALGRPDAAVIRNGVDLSRFARVTPSERLRGLPPPVLGLVGRIDWRVDPRYLAAALSAGTVVVAGEVVDCDLPADVHQLGRVPVEEVAAVMAGLDVALVCYREECPGDALKIYEYLAAGLPIVSTRFRGLNDESGEVLVATSPEEFRGAVTAAVHDRSPGADARRREAARASSWELRAAEILALVSERLAA